MGPFFRHYGLYGNLKVPLPEALLTRQENELPIIYKKKLDGWIAFLESDAPRAESPMREDDTTLKLVKDERVVEENRQPDRAR